jgi:glutamyl-tRNA reductase
MDTRIFVVGSSHSVASQHVRERLHADPGELYDGLCALQRSTDCLDEAVPLATCGRIEIYFRSDRPDETARLVRDMLLSRTGMDVREFEDHSYYLGDDAAVRHLFRVAAGLDSVIFGEAQILGQVRQALLDPMTERTAGTWLRRLFQCAIAAGKRVRAETAIGRGPASVAGAALRLLEREAHSFEDATAVVLGAGETGALAARLLRKAGVARLIIANRTLSKARDLAAELGGEPRTMENVEQLLSGADVVVGAVANRSGLVTAAMLGGAELPATGRRFILDLAHPRNFAADVATLPGVRVLDLAHIFEQVESAREVRAAEIPRAEAIVDAEVENFVEWARVRESTPVLRAMREQVLGLAAAEADRRSRGRTASEREDLHAFARSLARTLLHEPTLAIRRADPASPEGQSLLRTATTLFGLDPAGKAVPRN